jgi:transcriptional regulator with XRE-family HTH domain
MLLTPEMCRAARALLRWEVNQLAAASGVAASAIECFKEGSMVEPASVEVLLTALQDAGLEFIPAGGKSL